MSEPRHIARVTSKQVECPTCGAQPDESCRGYGSHWKRVEAAKALHDAAPYRLCCMERHHGPNCADGKVMCCICFARFDVADLVTYPGDDIPSDVCKVCAKRDERAIREARRGGS